MILTQVRCGLSQVFHVHGCTWMSPPGPHSTLPGRVSYQHPFTVGGTEAPRGSRKQYPTKMSYGPEKKRSNKERCHWLIWLTLFGRAKGDMPINCGYCILVEDWGVVVSSGMT